MAGSKRLDFPSGSDGKVSACNVGDLSSIPGFGRSPGGGHGNPLQYSCLENPHGQRSLAGYSPWGLKELDTTEQLSKENSTQSRLPRETEPKPVGFVMCVTCVCQDRERETLF